MNFAPKGEYSGVNTEVVLADSSLCTYSRFSQDFWTHGTTISKEESEDGIHYSFTFRNIAPHFLNSTVIIGDSNTTRLKFGPEKGQFGRWMPGKQITAYTVRISRLQQVLARIEILFCIYALIISRFTTGAHVKALLMK